MDPKPSGSDSQALAKPSAHLERRVARSLARAVELVGMGNNEADAGLDGADMPGRAQACSRTEIDAAGAG